MRSRHLLSNFICNLWPVLNLQKEHPEVKWPQSNSSWHGSSNKAGFSIRKQGATHCWEAESPCLLYRNTQCHSETLPTVCAQIFGSLSFQMSLGFKLPILCLEGYSTNSPLPFFFSFSSFSFFFFWAVKLCSASFCHSSIPDYILPVLSQWLHSSSVYKLHYNSCQALLYVCPDMFQYCLAIFSFLFIIGFAMVNISPLAICINTSHSVIVLLSHFIM